MKKIIYACLLFLFLIAPVTAQDSGANNKFGIHLAQPQKEDIVRAAELVNSEGGDWGYVTLVIQENDRNKGKWQEVFNVLRRLHLIPIIRLATNPEGSNWRRPNKEDVDQWISFLSSLNWVVKERYVILFNEPNHATEWGGKVDPENYAEIAMLFAQKLKEKSPDFFVMLAGLDASAPSARPSYEDEYYFLQEAITKIGKDRFRDLFDGLSSHSYPNPGFSGSPYASGRGTLKTYEWELSVFRELGVQRDLPVFITETGWSSEFISRDMIGDYFSYAFENVWKPDDRVVAVTPFILNYQGAPFLQFSWQEFGGSGFYPQYSKVQSMVKTKGAPDQEEGGEISYDLPKELTIKSGFKFRIRLKNTGQAIWDRDFDYELRLENGGDSYFFSDIGKLEPFQEGFVDLYFKTGGTLEESKAKISLFKNNKKVLEGKEWRFSKVALPRLLIRTSLFPKLKSDGDDFRLQVFDENENLVYEKLSVEVHESRGDLSEVPNVALGRRYRIVILKPYYLPRQTYVRFQKKEILAKFEPMLPLDFDTDGAFTFKDGYALIKNLSLFKLVFP